MRLIGAFATLAWIFQCCLLACASNRDEKSDDVQAAVAVSPASSAAASEGSAPSKVGSANYYLELASLHTRYQDPRGAGEHYAKAAALAENSTQALQAWLGVAQIRE